MEITVHLAKEGQASLEAYLERALPRANGLFAPAGLRFEVKEIRREGLEVEVVRGAAERDALAERVSRDGTIHVFLVPRLTDLERQDQDIAGRHWRCQGKAKDQRGRRYVIVAPAAALDDTLAHELGHFFGLDHQRDDHNLMKQRPRAEDAQFTPAQLTAIRKGLTRFRKEK